MKFNPLKFAVSGALVTAVLGLGSLVSPTTAEAASCWYHNGSLMRLEASGNQRWIYYVKPRSVLRKAGVRNGTLLFNGRKNGNWYSGTMRRFSKFCVGNPLTYHVEGPVSGSQTRVTLEGSRPVARRCQPTGKTAWDTLVFTYSHKC